MKTITAAQANRGFSRLLREVRGGSEVTILSRGKPVAKIVPIDEVGKYRPAMKEVLLSRLKAQKPTGKRDWSRRELYDG